MVLHVRTKLGHGDAYVLMELISMLTATVTEHMLVMCSSTVPASALSHVPKFPRVSLSLTGKKPRVERTACCGAEEELIVKLERLREEIRI